MREGKNLQTFRQQQHQHQQQHHNALLIAHIHSPPVSPLLFAKPNGKHTHKNTGWRPCQNADCQRLICASSLLILSLPFPFMPSILLLLLMLFNSPPSSSAGTPLHSPARLNLAKMQRKHTHSLHTEHWTHCRQHCQHTHSRKSHYLWVSIRALLCFCFYCWGALFFPLCLQWIPSTLFLLVV